MLLLGCMDSITGMLLWLTESNITKSISNFQSRQMTVWVKSLKTEIKADNYLFIHYISSSLNFILALKGET